MKTRLRRSVAKKRPGRGLVYRVNLKEIQQIAKVENST